MIRIRSASWRILYRPLARLWECSQSGGQNNRHFRFCKKPFCWLYSRLAAFPHIVFAAIAAANEESFCWSKQNSKVLLTVRKEIKRDVHGCAGETLIFIFILCVHVPFIWLEICGQCSHFTRDPPGKVDSLLDDENRPSSWLLSDLLQSLAGRNKQVLLGNYAQKLQQPNRNVTNVCGL